MFKDKVHQLIKNMEKKNWRDALPARRSADSSSVRGSCRFCSDIPARTWPASPWKRPDRGFLRPVWPARRSLLAWKFSPSRFSSCSAGNKKAPPRSAFRQRGRSCKLYSAVPPGFRSFL